MNVNDKHWEMAAAKEAEQLFDYANRNGLDPMRGTPTGYSLVHTPGPWEYGVRGDGSIWLSIGDPIKGRHYQGDVNVYEADARLICAAPDLLAALKAVVSISMRKHDAWDAALAAIAKAEGRTL